MGSSPPPAMMPSFPKAAMSVPRHAERARGVGAHELDDLHHLGIVRVDLGAIFDALLERALFGEQEAIGGAQIVDLFAREAAALEANHVEPAQMGVIADRRAE